MKEYKFKKHVSVAESEEVMKIIKYQVGLARISQEMYDAYPELQSYFEEVSEENQDNQD